MSGVPEAEDLVSDGWTDIIGKLVFGLSRKGADLTLEGIARAVELADFEKMEEIRARGDAMVTDRQNGGGAEALLSPVLQAALFS